MAILHNVTVHVHHINSVHTIPLYMHCSLLSDQHSHIITLNLNHVQCNHHKAAEHVVTRMLK